MHGLLQHCGLFEIACFHDRQRRRVDMTAEGGGNLLRRERRHLGFQRLIPFHGAAPKLAVSQSAHQALVLRPVHGALFEHDFLAAATSSAVKPSLTVRASSSFMLASALGKFCGLQMALVVNMAASSFVGAPNDELTP